MRAGTHKANPVDTWRHKYDAQLEAKPPTITWAPNGRGIVVAVYVNDPHMERTYPLRNERQAEAYAQRKAAS